MSAMILSSLGCFLAALAAALAAVLYQNGFGLADLFSFSIFTIPYAVLIGMLTSNTRVFMERRPLIVRLLLSGCAGVLCGFGWVLAVPIVLGPWFAAFSFPVLVCWILGAVWGILSGTVLSEPRKLQRTLAGTAAAIAASVFLALGFSVYGDYVRWTKGYELVTFKWQPGPQGLDIQNTSDFPRPPGWKEDTRGKGVLRFLELRQSMGRNLDFQASAPRPVLTSEEIALIREAGISGSVRFYSGRSLDERCYPNTIVLILQSPLDKETPLPVPKRKTAIFFQAGDAINVYPPGVPILKNRIVRIGPGKMGKGADRDNIFLWDGPQGRSVMHFKDGM